MNVIIYKQDNDNVAVIVPTAEALAQHGIMAIAIKDVPAGKAFKIIDSADLPSAKQEAWEVNDTDLTDGFGGESNEFNH
jgi:hypothetical protein